jgi:hypothetical protein
MSRKIRDAAVITAVFVLSVSPAYSTALQSRCAAAREKGVDFLAANQRGTGDFETYCWPTDNPRATTLVKTPFTVSQILYSLTFCDGTETVRGTKERAAAYLLSQQEPPGILQYYSKDSGITLSPDVDDTALAWAALRLFGYSISARTLELVRASRNEAGLFNTWIGAPSTWVGIDSSDVDVVVNLNALLLFGFAHQSIDAVCRYAVEQASGEFRRGSVYYPSGMAFTYAFSRAYADGGVSCLKDAIPKIRAATLSLQQSDGGWGDDLETALGVLTLLNTKYHGPALQRGLNAILARQSFDGGWAIAPAYRSATKPWRYGSRCLTTALCLEALAKYRRQ